jgi:ParB-like chromosome segregation protein Spo0J
MVVEAGATLELVPIEAITIRRRHRRQVDYTDLMGSIALIGLLEPIVVSEELVLGPGLHRLLACRDLGWTDIPAIVRPLGDLHLELAELDENLMRSPLTTLEQGEHLLRRSELLSQIGQRAQSGDNRWTRRSPDDSSGLPLTTADLAAAAGLHERVARRRMEAAAGLTVEERDAIRNTRVADSLTDLLTLVRLDPAKRAAVIAAVTAGTRSVATALRTLGDAAAPEDDDGEAAALDVADHLRTVGVTLIFSYDAPNPQVRARVIGEEDRLYARQSIRAEPDVFLQSTLDDAGVARLLAQIDKRSRAELARAQAAAAALAVSSRG